MSSCGLAFLHSPAPSAALIFIEPVLLPSTERCFRLPDSFSAAASVPHPARSPRTLYDTYLVNAKHRAGEQLLITPFVAARWTRCNDTALLMRPECPPRLRPRANIDGRFGADPVVPYRCHSSRSTVPDAPNLALLSGAMILLKAPVVGIRHVW